MIVVTGGAGFIGSALVWELNKQGIDDILVVDSLGKDEKWKNLVNLRFCDYCEKDDFLRMVEDGKLNGIDAIFHMGACSSTVETDASFLMKNNFEYTKKLALFCIEKRIRFIYASSAATYGTGEKGYSDKSIDELSPLNMYGYSKQIFDLWAQREGILDRIVGLKFFNVFGSNEYHKGDMRSLVNKAYYQVKKEGVIRLFKSSHPDYKDGEQKRDFIYIKDAVLMTLFFMEHKDVNGIFNIGTGNARTWNDLANAIFASLDMKPNIKYIEMPDILKDKYQNYTEAEMTKLKAAGYNKPCMSLEDAVYDYVRNYLSKNEYLSEAH